MKQWNMYKHCVHPVLSEGTMERFLSKLTMKETDQHALGRKVSKLNHQEATIKAAMAVLLRVLLSASLCSHTSSLCPSLCVPRLLEQNHWNQAGDRLGVGSRNWCNSFPQKIAEGNNLTETWKRTSCKDSDCTSCNLSAFFVLFSSSCYLFKSAQNISRSPLELSFPWLGKHRWPAYNRINQDIGKEMVNRGGRIQHCANVYVCIKSILSTCHVATVTPKIREKGILNIKTLQEIPTD